MTAHSADLLGGYLLESGQNLTQLESHLARLRAGPDPEAAVALGVLYHRMRGSAALYGFPQLSSLAALGERLLEPRPVLPEALRQDLLGVLGDVTACLRGALDGVASGQGEGEVGLTFAQIGGTRRLQALLAAQPTAFRAPSGPAQVDLTQAAEPQAAQASAGLEARLRDFRGEQTELWSYFAPEVREHLETLRAGLDAGEGGDVAELFRAAHTARAAPTWWASGFWATSGTAWRTCSRRSATASGRWTPRHARPSWRRPTSPSGCCVRRRASPMTWPPSSRG